MELLQNQIRSSSCRASTTDSSPPEDLTLQPHQTHTPPPFGHVAPPRCLSSPDRPSPRKPLVTKGLGNISFRCGVGSRKQLADAPGRGQKLCLQTESSTGLLITIVYRHKQVLKNNLLIPISVSCFAGSSLGAWVSSRTAPPAGSGIGHASCRSHSMANQAEKLLPLRRLEAPIHKFIKVAIPTDLERLQKHQMNIEKYQRCMQWDRLHQEHINASRTVQVREGASCSAHILLHSHTSHTHAHNLPTAPAASSQSLDAGGGLPDRVGQGAGGSLKPDLPAAPNEREGGPLRAPMDTARAQSEKQLPLSEYFISILYIHNSIFSQSQQEKIDSIEDHVSTAAENVEEGSRSLGKAVKYKMAVLPVAGALLGGVLGGPLGLLAGFKVVGVAAAVGGGLLGFTGGNIIQKNRQAKVDHQLQNLSSSRQEAGLKGHASHSPAFLTPTSGSFSPAR
ncbi:syntaxin-17 isoform X1 [Arapaima gigas]